MLLINIEEEKHSTIPLGSNFNRNATEERIAGISVPNIYIFFFLLPKYTQHQGLQYEEVTI